MTADFRPSPPDKEQVVLELADAGVELKSFTEYTFNSSFLSPSDGFTFTLAAERLDDATKSAMVPGAKVRLTLNGSVQATGHIDSISISASRTGGVEYRVDGRDRLGPAVNACANPFQTFKTGQTLEDILKTVFAPFGWSKPEQFDVSNEANRSIQSMTSNRGQRLSKGGKKHGPKPLKSYVQHQCAPFAKEGVFNFATRLATRAGLWIWCSADGEKLIVSKPDFESDPIATLLRNAEGGTNILDGEVRFDSTDQPTAIFVDAFTNGGEYGRGRARAYAFNPAVTTRGGLSSLAELHPDAREVELPVAQDNVVMIVPFESVQYATATDCQTQEQLENFLKREMALLRRKSLSVNYTVEGHIMNSTTGPAAWTVDTTVQVKDDVAGVDEVLYVAGRTFHKSRYGGTTTHLELIRLNSLEF